MSNSEKIPDSINFSEEEEKILKFWEENECFKNCLKQSKNRPKYTFYDGPPFATGLPHYGHILAGTIKDTVTRYAHQQGYHVERRFGWDCHGLPIEFEIDKLFGIKTPEEIYTKMGGIENYNKECRKIVMRFAGEWKQIIGRMGRWIDFENDYKTMYPWFMESIWWVFKQLFVKGLVYRGVKVMPYSTACTTPLSNFESGQNYKEVVDPSVVVTFPLTEDNGVAFLAWTTTPWTLPSNLALCVNPNFDYCECKEKKTGHRYILMECRLEFVFGKDHATTIEVLRRFKGAEIVGKTYVPIFDYFKSNTKAFRVLQDSYVSEDNGTGIVHQAPFFGEDDYRVCLKSGVIGKEDNYCPIDDCGRFVEPVEEFKGLYVKDADKQIIKVLKERQRLISAGQMKHSYPFCWRSDTPLIYKAVPSWFVRVEQFQQKLVNSSSQTYWVPEFVKDKRFGNWLRDARDWAISRNRYWGTPIPVWVSDDFQEVVAIGSIEELQALSGVTNVTDLHRENIDKITIPSKRAGYPPLKRIPEVFDCWFESGSMPFAQQHYPFENANDFSQLFPADFIAEGIDQTRGWFYTLIVVSTLLFDRAPFNNLIANGLVLASDGQKMSKSKKNYPDPMIVVKAYGADALRLYLINSPVVRAENLKFKEEGVRDVVKDVFLPWYNAFRFFFQNVDRLYEADKIVFTVDPDFVPTNVMDQWIVSFKESLLEFIGQEMKAYRLYTVVPRLTKFIDQLTNWYVRLNRRRIKGEFGTKDCQDSLNTLYDILMSMTKMMAPFTPYLTEFMFQRLVKFEKGRPAVSGKDQPSVHYEMMPKVVPSRINKEIEQSVSLMQRIIELGRILRDRKTIPIKYPLSEIVVLMTTYDEKAIKDELQAYEVFIQSELNVRRIVYTNDKSKFGVRIVCEPDHKVLGVKHKANYKKLVEQVKGLAEAQVDQLQTKGELDVKVSDKESVRITQEEVKFLIRVENKGDADLVGESDHELLVLLNCKQDESLVEEGAAREVINRVQKLKKKLNLVSTDLVYVCYQVQEVAIKGKDAVLQKFKSFIETAVKSEFNEETTFTKTRPQLGCAASEDVHLQAVGLKFRLSIYKEMVKCNGAFVNILLLHPHGNKLATVLLTKEVNLERLAQEVKTIFRVSPRKHLHFMDKTLKEVTGEEFKKSTLLFAYLEEHDKFVKEDPKLCDTVKAELAAIKEDQPVVRFVNFVASGQNRTFLVENPKGVNQLKEGESPEEMLKEVFGVKKVDSWQFF